MEKILDWAKPEVIWFIIGLVMLLIEFSSPGLIIFFFGVGAWVVAVLCLFADISLNMQLAIFIISSLLLLVLLRNWMKTIFKGHITSRQNLEEFPDEFVGKKAVVVKDIVPGSKGRVEFQGSHWDAESDKEIKKGTNVEIIGKDNITFKVKSMSVKTK